MASFASSYIPTTTAAATRSADVASIGGTAFSSWYRQDEGTVFADALKTNVIPAGSFHTLAIISDGSNSNRHVIFQYLSGGNKVNSTGTVSGAFQWNLDSASTIVAANAATKIASAYALNNIAFSVNATTPLVDTSALVPVGTGLYLGNANGIENFYNGHIRRLTFWPTRLPDNTLQSITQ